MERPAGTIGPDFDAIKTILGDDATPQRAVAIECQDLGGGISPTPDHTGQFNSQPPINGVGVRRSRCQFHRTVAGSVEADCFDDTRKVDDFNPSNLC